MKKKTVATLVGGMAAGAALGVLLAPKSGKETRDDLKKAFDDFMAKVKDIDADDVKKYVDKNIKIYIGKKDIYPHKSIEKKIYKNKSF